ncbi:MAG: hypothetical protein M1608_12000, partial [Candidatus Omnitrophica bacterium]|nr:hypothetical protein [Candidatus Omnitrophota bacterium]
MPRRQDRWEQAWARSDGLQEGVQWRALRMAAAMEVISFLSVWPKFGEAQLCLRKARSSRCMGIQMRVLNQP